MKSRIVCYIFLFICSYIVINRTQINDVFYNFDRSGYYSYLPALFIYHDVGTLSFYAPMAEKYNFGGGPRYGMHEMPNGKRVNKYAIGASLFEMPTFLMAHAFCLATGKYDADGYSDPYEYALIFNSIIWSFIGLLILRRFLLRYFTDPIVAITIACIGFGTNFYCHAAFEQGMSHNFSFVLFASILLYTEKWLTDKSTNAIYALGIILGLIAITRPVNVIVVLIPLLWKVHNKRTAQERAELLSSQYKHILNAFILCVFVAGMQMAYWKYTGGSWLFYSYQGEHFDFTDPYIIKGLFSFRKGWFVYTPMAFIGMVSLFYTPKQYTPAIITFFAIMIYVVFSWENWYYGGSFGARPLIETLPLLALPLAFLTKKIVSKRRALYTAAYSLLLAFLIAVNLFQSYQYVKGTIHYDRMTYQYYMRVFGKIKASEEDWKHLMPQQEYEDEINSWNKN
jgi:ABC-type multidrug transport system fused ATPase/permease subunit